MTYIDGFVAAVPKANKDAYLKHAKDALPMFKEIGVTRMVETWEDDIKDGKLNDLRMAVKATADEEIVFSWMEYPSKAVRDAAVEKMHNHSGMDDMMSEMPFDGKRMIYGGFEVVSDAGAPSGCGYVDGCVIPIPSGNKADYAKFAKICAEIFADHGASRVIDCWGDDVPDGEQTDLKKAVLLKDGETVAFGWVEWPNEAARNAGWEKVMSDKRMNAMPPPFDGKRMIFGGFQPILHG